MNAWWRRLWARGTGAPEVHYVPPVIRHGYEVQPARWFVSVAGWGRRFGSREAALNHADTLWGKP